MAARSRTHEQLSAPLALPLRNIDGTLSPTIFTIRAIAGTTARGGVMLSLIHVATGDRHLVGLGAESGRYEVTGIGQGSKADTQVELAMNEVLATDTGHQEVLDAIASLDAFAVTHGLERGRLFRRGIANAWSIDVGDAPTAIHEAVHACAETCTGTIADLGQALLHATVT